LYKLSSVRKGKKLIFSHWIGIDIMEEDKKDAEDKKKKHKSIFERDPDLFTDFCDGYLNDGNDE
jgi:hypothetical protein